MDLQRTLSRRAGAWTRGLCVLGATSLGCGPPLEPADVTLGAGDTPHAVSDRFLSFTLDASRLVKTNGDAFDFAQPRLAQLAAPLRPAYLRLGGTRSDATYYDLSDAPIATPPAGYDRVLTRAIWDAACDFATQLDLELLFTLNAGPGPRDADGQWTSDQARALITYSVARECPVAVWELGNEINGFIPAFGVDAYIDGEQYAADAVVARALLDELDPDAALAGPTSAYWPLWGEMIPILPDFMAAGGATVDIVTWHYYPQQSERCALQSRLAETETLLQPENLDELQTWAAEVEGQAADHAPLAQIWLDETSHAQCGGVPGVSDRYVTGFWWLDQLGLLARRGQPVQMRQSLVGGDYSLLVETTLAAAPDYFTSVLWKRLMGATVLEPHPDGEASLPSTLRAYLHCAAASSGVSAALINLDPDAPIRVDFTAELGSSRGVYLLTADDLLSATVDLNGERLEVDAAGGLPPLVPQQTQGPVEIPPLAYGFVHLPDADFGACLH